ncbi:MAG: DUF411 domain-containing protein [Gammaproteobacteria bacterium]|nr:MAG: DUF411 domain-containing protein [Gammaproteobacteria bacterium]
MSKNFFWRSLITGVLVAGLLPQMAFSDSGKQAALESIIVYKSPTCGCCSKWVRHLQDNGFEVDAINRNDMGSVKSQAGVPRRLASCHTASIGGYVIEGHVPAADIKRLLQERPAVAGLTVPGMPMGSPGMEGPRQDKYKVLTFDKAGNSTVFSRY